MNFNLDVTLIVYNIVAFLLLLIIVKWLVLPKLQGAVDKRKYNIDTLINENKQKNEVLEQKIEEVFKEQKLARELNEALMAEAKINAKQQREEIILKAGEEARDLIVRAKLEFKRDSEKEIDAIRRNMGDVVVASVRKILEGVVDEEVDHKIVLEHKKLVNNIERL